MHERTLNKIVGMWMLLVQVAHLRRESAGAKLQARGQRARLGPGFFQFGFELAVLGVRHRRDAPVQVAPQRAGGADVAVAQGQALVAMAQGQFGG